MLQLWQQCNLHHTFNSVGIIVPVSVSQQQHMISATTSHYGSGSDVDITVPAVTWALWQQHIMPMIGDGKSVGTIVLAVSL